MILIQIQLMSRPFSILFTFICLFITSPTHVFRTNNILCDADMRSYIPKIKFCLPYPYISNIQSIQTKFNFEICSMSTPNPIFVKKSFLPVSHGSERVLFLIWRNAYVNLIYYESLIHYEFVLSLKKPQQSSILQPSRIFFSKLCRLLCSNQERVFYSMSQQHW